LQGEQMICAVFNGLFEGTRQVFLMPKRRHGRSGLIKSDAGTCRQIESPKAQSMEMPAD
jgi:hypothetical protein